MTPTITTLSAADLANVAHRSRQACIVFRDQDLPAGCRPGTADLAVETLPSGEVQLLVRHGVTSTGADTDLTAWLSSGQRQFGSIQGLVTWLTARYGPSTHPAPETPAAPRSVPAAEDLTDLNQVRASTTTALPSPEELTAALTARVLGQDRAVAVLAEMVARHLSKVRPTRPATALLVGPTGSGKTLAAQTLAGHLTSRSRTRWEYLRLDMNEFSEKHTASRLFGAPPGYVGYGDGQDLATHLRRHPRTVIVLDEIDKAHPSLWFALMNLLDTGRLVTPAQAPVQAREAIILLTSNKDADLLMAQAEEGTHRVRDTLRASGYPPEIVGRITSVAVFTRLDHEAYTRITTQTIARVGDTYGIGIQHVDPDLVSLVLSQAPDPDAGIRDLEYHIDALLGPVFSTWRLEHAPDTTTVHVHGTDPIALTAASQDHSTPMACVPPIEQEEPS